MWIEANNGGTIALDGKAIFTLSRAVGSAQVDFKLETAYAVWKC